MKKDAARLLVVVLVIFLLLFSACITKKKKPGEQEEQKPGGPLQLPGQAPQPNVPQQPETPAVQVNVAEQLQKAIGECKKQPKVLEADSCLVGLAKEKQSDEPCRNLELFSKDECRYQVALITKDEVLCGKMTDRAKKNSCLEVVGKATNKMELCRIIQENSKVFDSCADPVARANASREECNSVIDKKTRDGCLSFVAEKQGDTKTCGDISPSFDGQSYARDKCYEVADKNKAGETCFLLLGKPAREKCFLNAANVPDKNTGCDAFADTESLNSCYYWVGSKTKNPEVCYRIDANKLSSECAEKIVSAPPSDSVCGEITDYRAKNRCLINAALDTNSVETCSTITSEPGARNNCLKKVAIKTEDASACEKIARNDRTTRDECFSGVALDSKTPEFCEKVYDDNAYYTCFSKIALNYSQPSICGLAKRTEFNSLPYSGSEYCYNNYAVKKKEPLVCEKIIVPSLRENCKADAKKATG